MKYKNETQNEKELLDALALIQRAASLPENLTPWQIAVKVAARLANI